MVPVFYTWLHTLPLLANGKVDRRALSAIGQTRHEPERAEGGEAARNPVEETLVGIWEQVLGREHVGISDNFFDLGGHSLLITRVISRVREQLQVELPLRTLFENPTIADFAEAIIQQELEQADSDVLLQMLTELEGKR
jgi:acyl carrier protein